MKKAELLELLKDLDDDDEIGAFWDDCEWPILGIIISYGKTEPFAALIDCR